MSTTTCISNNRGNEFKLKNNREIKYDSMIHLHEDSLTICRNNFITDMGYQSHSAYESDYLVSIKELTNYIN